MRDSFQRQCEELRTRIARSRRSLERQATLLTHDPLRLTRYGPSGQRTPTVWSALFSELGLALSRRVAGAEPATGSWLQRLLGATLSALLDRTIRHLRVLAWQAKKRRHDAQGDQDD
jgi:hypothetical protein